MSSARERFQALTGRYPAALDLPLTSALHASAALETIKAVRADIADNIDDDHYGSRLTEWSRQLDDAIAKLGKLA